MANALNRRHLGFSFAYHDDLLQMALTKLEN
jgi:hypothetical protein